MTVNAEVVNIAADLTGLAVECSTLNPLPGNPRIGDIEAVKRSYAQFGQRKPIVARRKDRTVIAGNHQLAAAQALGWSHIAVVWTDDDDATAKAFALADNRTADLGTYDDDLLAALLADVQATGDADLLAATGYQGDDLDKLLRRVEFLAGQGDPDDAPPLPDVAVSRPGDLWLLGPHRLLCGDATQPGDHATLLDGQRADMIWTDPPYGVGIVGGTHDPRDKKNYGKGRSIENDTLSAIDLRALLSSALGNAAANTRPGAVWFVAAPAGPLFTEFGAVLSDLDVWRHTIIWSKDNFVFGRSDYHYQHEPIFYGWTPGSAHREPPDRTQSSVWPISSAKKSMDHPTMKPVELVARAISNHTDDGDLVLDPFGGSGTTLIAANDLGRRAALLELDPRYVDVICRRYQQHTGDQPILAATGEPHDFVESA